MRQDIFQPYNLFPLNLRHGPLHIIGQITSGFSDDFKVVYFTLPYETVGVRTKAAVPVDITPHIRPRAAPQDFL